MVTEQLYWRKILCGWFHFIWLWLLLAIMKRCTELSALQLYRTFLTVPDGRSHLQLKISLLGDTELLKFETLVWNSLRDTLVKILLFRCWREFSFVKNPEIFSAKTLIPCLLKCNLLLFKYWLGSMISLWERNSIFLSWQIKMRQLLTLVALFSSLPDIGTTSDIDTVFVSFFNDVHNAIIDLDI